MVDVTQKKKKNPLPEFCLFYFGTLVLLFVLDQQRYLFTRASAWDLVPPFRSASLLLSSLIDSSSGVGSNLLFVFSCLLLTYPLHLWRQLVKSLFVTLASKGAGLHPKTAKHGKFLEQAWLAVHYSLATALEVYAIQDSASGQLWPPLTTKESRQALVMSNEQRLEQHALTSVKACYMLQFTFYFLELLTLVLDKKSRSRSDAFVYAIHHILTVFLIGFSYVFFGQHAGLLVLFCHDVGDIFLPIAKCFVYTEDHAKVAYSKRTFHILEALGGVFFVTFLITFGVLRLILFPTLIYVGVYHAAWFGRDFVESRDGPDVLAQAFEEYSFVPEHTQSAFFFLTSGLILLFPLHVYWYRLALRVAYRAVFGIYDDERSDDDEDETVDAKLN